MYGFVGNALPEMVRNAVHGPAVLDASPPLIKSASTAVDELLPSPLEPSWILQGNPVARGLNLAQSADGLISCGLWDCTAGVFRYFYSSDEFIYILAGEAIVQDSQQEHFLRAGDVAHFPGGAATIWTVPTYVKKYCIHRMAARSLLSHLRFRTGKMLRSILSFRRS